MLAERIGGVGMGRRRAPSRGVEVYAVLIGDVVRSREFPDREALRRLLVRALRSANRQFSHIIVSPLTVSAGDEFQGLLEPRGGIIRLLNSLTQCLFPLRLRVGVGIRGITTRVTRRPQEMDGPAFRLARGALEEAKNSKPPAELLFHSPDETFDLAANAIALLARLLKQRWKPLHWRRSTLRDDGLDVNDIAEREGVSPAAVHYSLATCGYYAIRQAEANLAALIEKRWGETVLSPQA